jgi:hypothetical protein
MTPETIALVRSSFGQVLPVADLAATLFYDRLVEQEPRMRGLFADDLVPQQHALLRTLQPSIWIDWVSWFRCSSSWASGTLGTG